MHLVLLCVRHGEKRGGRKAEGLNRINFFSSHPNRAPVGRRRVGLNTEQSVQALSDSAKLPRTFVTSTRHCMYALMKQSSHA